MPPVNRRAAAPAAPSRPAARPAARRSAPGSSGVSGAGVLDKINEEQTKAEARREAQASMSGMPFRFFCPVGETREIVVVDEQPNFVRHEHNLKDSRGKWSIFCSCVAENANCPVCESNPDKPAYFAMYLTVIDLTPYVNKDDIEVPWSKKLLVVKSSQQKKIMRLYERHGTLRGMVLSMTRDGDKDAAIGNDIEFVEFFDEDALAEYYNEYEGKDKKLIQIVGGEAFNYDELFPAQTEEMLAAIVGGHVNNHDSHNRAIGRSAPGRGASSGDGWQDRTPARGAAPSRPAPRGRAAPEPEVEDATYVDDAPADDEPPARAARPAGRPAPRTVAPPPAGRPAPRGRPAPEPDPEPEDPPQRGSMVARRQALRR